MNTGTSLAAYDPLVEPCPMCGSQGQIAFVEQSVAVVVRGENFSVKKHAYKCSACGEEFQTPGCKGVLDLGYAEYRRLHNLLPPEEIRAWRTKLDLKQSEFAALLGWSTATVSRYENGALQDDAHDRALRAAMTSEGLAAVLNAGVGLPPAVREKVGAVLAHSLHSGEALVQALRQKVDVLAGHPVDWGKTLEVLMYLCSGSAVPRTKLNKLLFYVDFLLQKSVGRTLTGLPYIRMQYGPVPMCAELVYSSLQELGFLAIETQEAGDYIAYMHKATRVARFEIFDPSELDCLAFVQTYFRAYTAKAVSEYSHKEAAWLETRSGDKIDPAFAERLSLSLPGAPVLAGLG